MASPVPPWLSKAHSYLGFHETGNNRGIEEFISLAHTGSLGDPWCAIFINACLGATGFPGTGSPAARSFIHSDSFVQLGAPALGCITVMWRGSPNAETGHVYFYCGENSNGILALGGNQDDQVKYEYQPKARVLGYYWPKSYPLAIVGAISVRDGEDPIAGTPPAVDNITHSGKGSWYSQNPPDWHDPDDEPNSNVLGVPDNRQGIAFYNRATLGEWFNVTEPGGKTYLVPHTDIGPNPRTGRAIDISARLAAAMGFTPHSFPTDAIFSWRPAKPPRGLETLSPHDQAVQYTAIQTVETSMPDTTLPSTRVYTREEVDQILAANQPFLALILTRLVTMFPQLSLVLGLLQAFATIGGVIGPIIDTAQNAASGPAQASAAGLIWMFVSGLVSKFTQSATGK